MAFNPQKIHVVCVLGSPSKVRGFEPVGLSEFSGVRRIVTVTVVIQHKTHDNLLSFGNPILPRFLENLTNQTIDQQHLL